MNLDNKLTVEELVDKHYPDGYYDFGDDYNKYNLNGKRIDNQKSLSQIGRVITQRGLVGALVLSFNPKNRIFKVQLKDDIILDGYWVAGWLAIPDPAGITSDGWSVGDVEPDDLDIPF